MLMLFALGLNVMAEDLDAQYATTLLKKGAKAPSFELKDQNGKVVSLKQFKGNYLLIDFWASWCPDCRRISPNIEKIAQKYSPKGLKVLGISFDTDKEAWLKYINKNGTPKHETHVCEFKKMKDSKVAKDYGVKWIPSLYVIDKNGNVLLSTVEINKVEKLLNSLFK